MENTCEFPDCAFAKFHKFKKAEQCCNYLANWFKANAPGADHAPKLIKDCAPRRTLLIVQELYNRDIGVQKALEQQRNVTFQVISKFNEMVDRANERLRELPNGRDAQGISCIELPEAGGSEGQG